LGSIEGPVFASLLQLARLRFWKKMLGRVLAVFGVACATAEVFFEESFDDESWEKRWVHSTWKGANGPSGKFELSSGKWHADDKVNKGIRTPENMKYHSVTAKLAKPFSSKGKNLVVQFSVKHETQETSFCGGGYIKLMGSDIDQANFGGDTPYKIMFGPDICGYDVARIHTIFNWKGENLLRNEDIKLGYDDKNAHTHLYTLVVKPDNTYEVYFDLQEKAKGSLHAHWNFPNKTADDAKDKKPADWVDTTRMDDPAKTKPADWVTDQKIRDPEAGKPSEWDDDEDGSWEAPMIDNPAFKGAWIAEQIDNPAYKGEWKPKQLENPDYVEDVHTFDDIGSVGFELWTVNLGSIFDNILVTDSFEHAKAVGEKVFKALVVKEKEAKTAWDKANGKGDSAGSADAPAGGAGGEDDDDDDDSEAGAKGDVKVQDEL